MQKSVYILNIETSTKNCSVSISKNETTIALKELCAANFSHAEKLHQFILEVLTQSNLTLTDLDAIAVGKGPGSYTGLRIGVSAVKGLCFALDIPLLAINTLTILANAITVKDAYIIPLLDARRLEVYTAVFNDKSEEITQTNNHILNEQSFTNYLTDKKVYFLGDGASKTKDIITNSKAIFLENYHPSAKEMGKLAYQKFINNDFEDVAYFEPFYLKDFHVTVSKKK